MATMNVPSFRPVLFFMLVLTVRIAFFGVYSTFFNAMLLRLPHLP